MDQIPEIKFFGVGDRVYVQAQQVWLILVSHVGHHKQHSRAPAIITYGDLAESMDFPDRRAGRTLARPLGIVGHYCIQNELPPLNAIVVNQVTGQPGDHVVLRKNRSVAQEQSAVMRQNWFKVRVPTTGTFRKVWDVINLPKS
jgi:hypothetical protein